MSDFLTNLRARRPVLSEPVTVPEWDHAVIRIRKLSVIQKIRLNNHFSGAPRDEAGRLRTADAIEFAAELLALTLVDETGSHALFDSPEGRDYLRCEELPIVQRLADQAIDHNDLGPPKKTD